MCDNYLVCADVLAEIFLCLSSERASSATRPGLCGLDVLHCVRQLLVVLTGAVIKICVSRCVADDASCEPASEELTLRFRKLKQPFKRRLFISSFHPLLLLLETCSITYGYGFAFTFRLMHSVALLLHPSAVTHRDLLKINPFRDSRQSLNIVFCAPQV